VSQIYLLNITGPDRRGLSAELSSVFEQQDIRILDIGQSVIHDQVSLGMMIQLAENIDSETILAQFAETSARLGVDIRTTEIDENSYADWIEAQGQDRYILTLLAREVSAEEIARVTRVTAEQGLNIKSCIEFAVKGTPKDPAAMRANFLRIASELDIDIAIQQDDAYRRTRRLVCFDMDSTLIQTEVIDELAKHAGVGDQVAAITEQAMQGKLDFNQSFRRRMALLEGLDESVLEDIANKLPIMEGAERLIKNLKAYGFKTAILSGGFTYFGKFLQNKFGIDYVHANTLERIDGKLTGNVIDPITANA